ncbi:MAG TPA: DUF4279 domain-containing protein [Candidatus Thiothrix moscowensis]|uniref:DUF4279 domain-containing protein n=1 Tax=unclassified Thiothrix TaxID=2636184 RepID=UPI0025EA392F|nr:MULTISPECIES: DUF4279 domain-containing protein [unclassified Thiothrix]HRJ54279.1 DUF4279 domain-containing protein [Candidatus Thiothrix moscowensis]HRJ94533.1 DUF4279 domain-containing protein [Candidatus Thiothrix moscowensis]
MDEPANNALFKHSRNGRKRSQICSKRKYMIYRDLINMSNIRSYFLISGFDINPELITKTLGIEPTDAATKGTKKNRKHPADGEFIVLDSYWELYSPIEKSYNIEDYIDDLIGKISPILPQLEKLKSESSTMSLSVIIVIKIHPEDSLPGLSLCHKMMRILSDNSINLVIDIV